MNAPGFSSKDIVVAIDGPAASGKSSVSRSLARRLGFTYVNSGKFYRAVTWLSLQFPEETVEPGKLVEALENGRMQMRLMDAEGKVFVDGEEPGEDELAGERVNARVSRISAIPEVRSWLLGRFRAFAKAGSLIMEGRDIGTVVFPSADFKFFLDANPAVRELRRKAQGIGDSIAARDCMDSARTEAPLAIAADAVVIDSSGMSLEEVIDSLFEKIAGRVR